MRALVTGATGFVGPRLIALLDRPVIVTRDGSRASALFLRQDLEIQECDINHQLPSASAWQNVEAVFHLAGESVAGGRWTKKRKQRIRESRIHGTRNMVEALAQLPPEQRPRTFISASAVGYYGSRGDEVLTEKSPAGDDFLAEVCVAWEREAERAAELGVRTAMLRIGIVLGPGGGALGKMLTPFRFGLGGRLGSGRQWMPWVQVDDLAKLFVHVANTASIHGPVNAVAPQPVRNREFTQTLARALHRPAFLPAPYFGLRLLLGQFAEVLFASQKVEPCVAAATQFKYNYPTLDAAIRSAVNSVNGGKVSR
jgi:uncharacterized protein